MAVKAMLLVALLTAVAVGQVSSRRNEGVTDVVSNLVLTPALYMIDASWELQNPSNETDFYWVTFAVGADIQHSCTVYHTATNTESCVFDNDLFPCTAYNVTVQPRAKNSTPIGVPASAVDYTLSEAPITPNPTCNPSGSTTANLQFTVSWTSPGECVQFTVSWEGDVLWQDDEEPIRGNVTTRAASVAIDDPRPYTRYSVTVTWSGGSAYCEGTTAQTAPSAPTSLSVVPASSRSLTASWSAPEQINGVLGDYTISWNADGGQTGSKTTAGTSFTIDGLAACVAYNVNVTASTGGGKATSDAVLGTTEAEAPPAVTSLTNTSSAARSVTLTWTRPDTACDVTEYSISYIGVAMWGTQDRDSGDNTTEDTSFVVTGLVPYSWYKMCVLGRNGAGDGAETCLEAVETKEAAPGAPASVTTKPSYSTVTVSWQAPKELNGVLRNYLLSWGDSSTQSGSEFLSNDTLNYEVEGLEPCHEYSFTVAGVTGGGTGVNATATGSPTTEVSAPAPVTCSLSGSLFTVTWTVPETECDIISNTVNWEGDVLWSDGQDNGEYTANANDSSLTLPHTVPYTRYTVSVAATVAGGVTGSEGTCQDRLVTPEEAPGAPASVTTKPSNSTVTVSWQDPKELNGVLRNYLLNWGGSSTQNGSELLSNDTLNYEVEGLEPCHEYSFSVAGVTGGGTGENGTATGSLTTDVSAPAPVTCSLSGSLVTVTWTAPETECGIVNNTVSWEGDVLWSDGQDNDEYTAGATDSSFTLSHTVPYTRYTVSVAATVTVGTTGSQGTCHDKLVTPEEAPSVPQNLSLSDATSTSLMVTWEAPEVMNGWLRNYAVTWGLGNDIVTREMDNATLNCKIDGLEKGTSYNISVKAVTISESEPATASFDTMPSDVVDPPSHVGAIIGAVVGAILVAALLAVAYVKRDWIRTRMNSSNNTNGSNGSDKQLGHYRKLEIGLAIKIESLASRPGSLTREFAAMDAKRYVGSTVIGSLPVNAGKNRYVNILPFDESRVPLTDNMANGNDYINASLVPSVTDPSFVLVATQTPKGNTVKDFWRMVWNLNVKTIVMLSDKLDGHKSRSDQYWPRGFDSDVIVQQFVIKLMRERVTAAFTERHLVVTRGEDSREVSQFQFSEWTTYDVSNSTEELLQFLCEVRKNVEPEQKRVVVHCLAGVGRSGTLITLWNLQQLVETLPQDIDVEDTILQLRRHRMHLVQTKEQYFLVLEALLEYLKNPAYWHPVKEVRHPPRSSPPPSPPPVYPSDKEIYMTPIEEGTGQRQHLPQQSSDRGAPDKQMYLSPPNQFRNRSEQQDGSHTSDQEIFQDSYLDII